MEKSKTKARPKADMFQCKVCPYNTLRKPFLDKHMQQKHGFSKVKLDNPVANNRTHRGNKQANVKRKRFKKTDSEDTDELEFGCEMCSFTTKDDVVFSKHLETHETEEQEMYQCTQCEFKTIEVSALRSHQDTHKKLELFKCPNCDYASIHKCNFRVHLKIHEDPAELEGFQCKFCDSFKSLHKNSLYKHISQKHPDDQNILQCAKCSYITPNRSHLIAHLKTHIDPAMLPTYHCDICDFETHNEVTIRRHVKKHKERQEKGEELIIKEIDGVTQVVWFCCDLCEFRTKYPRFVIRHKKVHARADEINRMAEAIVYGKGKVTENSVIDVKEKENS